MKKIWLSALLFCTIAVNAQESDDIKPAAKGVVYGEAITPGNAPAITVAEIEGKMVDGSFEGRVTGKVKEVCQAMGCWMSLEKSDGSVVKIKTKDHAFFLPKNIVGKTVMVEGVAEYKVETEAKMKHYAEDANKSKKEIDKIKGPQKELQLTAKSVLVLD